MKQYSFKVWMIPAGVIFTVGLWLLFMNVINAQVTVIEDSRLSFYTIQDENGEWYAYCVEGCDKLLDVASIDEIYASFPTSYEASNHSLILTGRVFNFTPPVMPTPSP